MKCFSLAVPYVRNYWVSIGDWDNWRAINQKEKIKTFDGSEMSLKPKDKSMAKYLNGGIIIGLGGALAGACPAPMYVLAGAGYLSTLVVIDGALLGMFAYGLLRKYLPL